MCKDYAVWKIFQSTLPVWGATRHSLSPLLRFINFNPRSPCGERLFRRAGGTGRLSFQSTLPVWGATHIPGVYATENWLFQSTLPVWGATILTVRSF